MSDNNSNDIATRCSICLDNTRPSRNFVEMGIAHLLTGCLAVEIGDPTSYSELLCVQCMAELIVDMENQQTMLIKHVITCRIAALIMVLMRLGQPFRRPWRS